MTDSSLIKAKIKILVIPDSFKGSMSSAEAGNAIKKGLLKASDQITVECIPISDGGEGLCESIMTSCGGRLKTVDNIIAPMGNKIQADFCILNDHTAVIEMAKASGFNLVDPILRNPMTATTYGTGQLIKAALDCGCKNIIIGLGGSATNDGGIGMMQALGVRFTDACGEELSFGGGELGNLVSIDTSRMDNRIKDTKIIAFCDVDNVLYGKNGASYTFASQKGANEEQIEILDHNMLNYADVIKRQLGVDVKDLPSAGAAGGMGAGLVAFLNADLKKGIDTVLDIIGFKERLKDVDLVITGEGKMDSQSLLGKAPVGIAERVKKYKNIPVLCIAGKVDIAFEEIKKKGLEDVFSIMNGDMDLSFAIENGQHLAEDTAERMMRLILIGIRIAEKKKT